MLGVSNRVGLDSYLIPFEVGGERAALLAVPTPCGGISQYQGRLRRFFLHSRQKASGITCLAFHTPAVVLLPDISEVSYKERLSSLE